MTDLAYAVWLFMIGAVVGAAYLGLLWASVRLLARRGRLSAYLLLAALRGGLVLAALWLAAALGLGAGGILIGLAGFVMLRLGVVRAANVHGRKDA